MNNFTNNLRIFLNHSIKGARLINMKKILTILFLIGLLAGTSLAQSQIKNLNQPEPERKPELKEASQPDLQATVVKSLTGTWLLTITPGEPGAPSFPGLYT